MHQGALLALRFLRALSGPSCAPHQILRGYEITIRQPTVHPRFHRIFGLVPCALRNTHRVCHQLGQVIEHFISGVIALSTFVSCYIWYELRRTARLTSHSCWMKSYLERYKRDRISKYFARDFFNKRLWYRSCAALVCDGYILGLILAWRIAYFAVSRP